MPIREGSIVTHGLRELIGAADAAVATTREAVRKELETAAVPVRDEARRLFMAEGMRFNRSVAQFEKSASNFDVKARAIGRVDVEQRLRGKGKRPDWGALQMTHALIPALERKTGEVERRLEIAMDEIIHVFTA